VKGHQDDSKKLLSYEAQLNVEADIIATKSFQRRKVGEIKITLATTLI
jgi:hypothetical protein